MLKRCANAILIILYFTLNSCNTNASVITLAANGKSDYVIVIPAKATNKEIKAANIITGYFKKVTGVSLLTVSENNNAQKGIYVGNTQKSKLFYDGSIKGDGFTINTDTANVFIQGGSGQGIIYGAYGFVEKYLGCRKFDAGPAFYKQQDKLIIAQGIADLQNPSFVYREAYYPPSLDAEYLQWHKLQRFEDLWGIWGHSFFRVISPEVYFKSHPEYFAEVDGKRMPTQLCLSNPEVLKLFTAYIAKQIKVKPDAVYWSIAQNDGGGYCTCKYCRETDRAEGGPQGSIIKFVNAVAAKFPQQQFTTLAYSYSIHPPLHLKPAENVTVMLSSIAVNREQPIENAPSAAEFRSVLKDWKAVTERLFIWDYTTQFTNYLAPFPDYTKLDPNLSYFKNNGIKGVFSQGSGETYADIAELNSYLLAKGLWNDQAQTQEIIREFTEGYYGEAAPYIQTYLSRLQSSVATTNAKLDIYGNPVNNRGDYLSPGNLKNYIAIFKDALNSVKGNELLTNRVLKARLSLQYAILQQSKVNEKGVLEYMMRFYDDVHNAGDLIKNISVFCRNAENAGVKELSENGISPQEYLMQWKAFIANTDNKMNLAANAKVILKFPYSTDYPANKEKTLTDGLFGTLDYSFNWLFLYGTDLDATIDLGSEKTLSTVKMNFLEDAKHHIYGPSEVMISTSLDNKTFTAFSVQKFSVKQSNAAAIEQIVLSGTAKARFIRVIAKCLSPGEAGITQTNKKPALCCDEVIVN